MRERAKQFMPTVVLGKSASGDMLRHMAQQEEAHLEQFSQMMAPRAQLL
jgi:hypothetical protein